VSLVRPDVVIVMNVLLAEAKVPYDIPAPLSQASSAINAAQRRSE